MVAHRRHVPFNDAANEICEHALKFVQLGQRERIALRNRVESTAEQFDWQHLSRHYREAHALALQNTEA